MPENKNKAKVLLKNNKLNKYMPATSRKQQKAAGAALSAKRGKTKVKNLKGVSKKMYKSMDEKQLKDFAKTKRKNLPTKKD